MKTSNAFTRRGIVVAVILFAPSIAILSAQDDQARNKTPFSYEVNLGGAGPMGKSTSSYSPTVMFGGGVGLPIGRWVSLDLVSMDFGFGTTNQTQTIEASDGTTRQTKNYQMMFSSGPRVNLPLGRKVALGVGGGYGAIFQNEYVPDQFINNGYTTVIQSVNCTTCSREAFQGPYIEARLFGRSNKYNGFGVTAKYYIVKDSNHSSGSSLYMQPQRWLTMGVTFSFGI